MSLPDLIEIVPLSRAVRAEVCVPGSKSITNRALVLAALGSGEAVLEGALWSEDTQVMVDCLRELGFLVNVEHDPREACNCTITVYGKGGALPPGGTPEQPVDLFVGNAGTAARFLAALVCLGQGVYRLQGVPRMHQRPQAALFQALRELGYRIDSAGDRLPAVIHGAGARAGSCQVSIEESSQFASALLLCAGVAGWQVRVAGENAEESPYVAMTRKLVEVFPRGGGRFQIEPDASSGSYFWGAGWLSAVPRIQEKEERGQLVVSLPIGLEAHPVEASGRQEPSRLLPVQVATWPASGWQIDSAFPDFLPLPRTLSRASHLGDSIMTAIVLAADQDAGRPWQLVAGGIKACGLPAEPVRFTDLGRLRVQECERVAALRTELTRCGARVIEEGDTLSVFPSRLRGAEIETYQDHRMAMCFAILGLKVPGIKLNNPSCVKKTFPNFFQKLAAQAPDGLGAKVLDGRSGRVLTQAELFAE
jgi:3-phosphoshikimate 1-carboxyvinyltransferase